MNSSEKNTSVSPSIKPTLLMILDGWGYSGNQIGNAVAAAKTPNLDRLAEKYPCALGMTSGEAVGLPAGQMGNSEVGHLNIGSGRIVYQDLTLINKEIADGTFNQNPILLNAVRSAIKNDRSLHLMGLVSYGGVHSYMTHLQALLKLAQSEGLTRVYVHAFLDGRDVAPKAAAADIKELQEFMTAEKIGELATVTGRYYAMDRDKRWERTEKAYNALSLEKDENADADVTYTDAPEKALDLSYEKGETDEFVKPIVVLKAAEAGGKAERVAAVKDGDSVIFFNFRPDRARQLTYAFVNFDADLGFKRKIHPKINFVCMTPYDEGLGIPIAYPPKDLKNTLGEYLSALGKKQLRIAETEKYAHITFFFNGGVEEPNKNEDRILIPSPKVATYDLKPEMSAYEVTDALLKKLDENKYEFIVLNFANMDMVGHTGITAAAIAAVEAVDGCVGKLTGKIIEKDGAVFITADHGNAERMIEEDGTPCTSPTTNPVKMIYVDDKNIKNGKPEKILRNGGSLCDIAPTLLEVMGLPVPKEMTGKTLLVKNE